MASRMSSRDEAGAGVGLVGGRRTMLAVDMDPGLRAHLKAVARRRFGSARVLVEALVRAYLDEMIPDEIVSRYTADTRRKRR